MTNKLFLPENQVIITCGSKLIYLTQPDFSE